MLKTCGSARGVRQGHGRTFPSDRLLVIEQAGARSTGREGTPVLTIVNDDGSKSDGSLTDEIVREGAGGCSPRDCCIGCDRVRAARLAP
jgi:hypothetical protein